MKKGGSILPKGIDKFRVGFFKMLPGLEGSCFPLSLMHGVCANETEQVLLEVTALCSLR